MSACTNVASLPLPTTPIGRLENLVGGGGRIVFVLSDKNCGEILERKGEEKEEEETQRQVQAEPPTVGFNSDQDFALEFPQHSRFFPHNCTLRRVNFGSTLANNGAVIDAIYIRLSFFTIHLVALIKTPCFGERGDDGDSPLFTRC